MMCRRRDTKRQRRSDGEEDRESVQLAIICGMFIVVAVLLLLLLMLFLSLLIFQTNEFVIWETSSIIPLLAQRYRTIEVYVTLIRSVSSYLHHTHYIFVLFQLATLFAGFRHGHNMIVRCTFFDFHWYFTNSSITCQHFSDGKSRKVRSSTPEKCSNRVVHAARSAPKASLANERASPGKKSLTQSDLCIVSGGRALLDFFALPYSIWMSAMTVVMISHRCWRYFITNNIFMHAYLSNPARLRKKHMIKHKRVSQC